MASIFSVQTQKKRQFLDITEKVSNELTAENQNGSVLIFVRHTTCALIICEIEEDLETDFLKYLDKVGPVGPFNHSHTDEYHTPSHILSAIIGHFLQIPLQKGQMQLGTWQRVCLLELNGPRTREISVQSHS